MTEQELQQLKKAAERIHAAAVKAGKWEGSPDPGTKLMEVVCHIARAAEADDGRGNCLELKYFDEVMAECEILLWSPYERNFVCNYRYFILRSVQGWFAAAVVDILDIIEANLPDWEATDGGIIVQETVNWETRTHEYPIARFCWSLVTLLVGAATVETLFFILEELRNYCDRNGIDLCRHVELRIKYLELGGTDDDD